VAEPTVENQVAERRGPFAVDEELDEPPGNRDYRSYYVGDRFLSTYLHGSLGPIARTAELDNNDVRDNRDHYHGFRSRGCARVRCTRGYSPRPRLGPNSAGGLATPTSGFRTAATCVWACSRRGVV
jgi:hypothetical protein